MFFGCSVTVVLLFRNCLIGFSFNVLLHCLHRLIFCLLGRYCKFSRELSQTPWLLHGELKCASSVEELIAGPLMPVLGATGEAGEGGTL